MRNCPLTVLPHSTQPAGLALLLSTHTQAVEIFCSFYNIPTISGDNNDNSEATLFSISVLVAEKGTKDQNVLCSVCCCKSEYYVYLLYTNLVVATFYFQ